MRGLSWRDFATTVMAIIGGTIVYARLQDWNWWLVGSWRGAIAALAVIGIAMCATNAGDIQNKSWLSRIETWLAVLSVAVIVAGLVTGWQWVGLTLAGVLGALWLTSTARNARRTIIRSDWFNRHYYPAHTPHPL